MAGCSSLNDNQPFASSNYLPERVLESSTLLGGSSKRKIGRYIVPTGQGSYLGSVEEPGDQNHIPVKDTLVVGVGASAGGLDALKRLFAGATADSRLSYVVVQHLDPTHSSALASLLERETALPVQEIGDGDVILPGRIYVLPPNHFVLLEGNRLRLNHPQDRRGTRSGVDYFFRSLAQQRGDRAIAVLLSGTGKDGTNGAREVKQAGGLTVVQDPEDAAHAGMLKSAIDSGCADIVMPCEKIIPLLNRYANHSSIHGVISAHSQEQDGSEDLSLIIEHLKHQTDFDFRKYRRATLDRRVRRRMGLRQLGSMSEYFHLLKDHPRETETLARDLLIGVTGFFRDSAAWDILARKVIRPIFETSDPATPVRVWVAGCATGEEAYTVAMLLDEQAERAGCHRRFQIFATDISEDALQTARTAIYPASIEQELSNGRLQRYFSREEDHYRIKKFLRETVVFASQNVLSHPPFANLDLICCRNLLIYLKPEAQSRILSVFQFALNQDRYLFLGSSESLGKRNSCFTALSKKWRIYRRNEVPVSANLDLPKPIRSGKSTISRPYEGPRGSLNERICEQLLKESRQVIAAVNRDNRVVALYGPIDDYFQMTGGTLSPELPDILNVCREGLRAKLRGLLKSVRAEQTLMEVEARVKRDGRYHPCFVSGRLLRKSDADDPHLLLVFDAAKVEEPKAASANIVVEAEELQGERSVRELELELSTTRAQLISTVEDLETTNEELKASNEEAMAINEELQSNNEELETSKEELQSLNEELTTLNHQLETKLNQLQRTTNDLKNLISSTQIGTVFLDSEFKVRLFTPAACDLFHLIKNDIGRPIQDINRRFVDESLLADGERVLATLQPRESEIRTEDGRTFTRRIFPYRSEENRIEGVVITFIDVTRLKSLAERMERGESQQAALAELGQMSLTSEKLPNMFDRAIDLLQATLGTEFAKLLEFTADGNRLFLRAGVGWRPGLVGNTTLGLGAESQAGYTLLSKSPVIVTNLERETRFSPPDFLLEHQVVSGMSVIIQGHRQPFGVLGVHSRDSLQFSDDDVNFLQSVANLLGGVIERERVNEALKDSAARFQALANNIPQLTWMTYPDGEIFWYNQRWFDYTGTDLEQCRGWGWRSVHHPDHVEAVTEKFRSHVASGEPWEDTFPLKNAAGDYRWFLSRAFPVRDDNGQIVYWFGSNTDITERHETQQQLLAARIAADEARSAAEIANEAKSQFLANISHEIRTPMTAILGYADVLRSHLGDPDNVNCVNIIKQNGEYLCDIINDILDLSKIEAGKLVIHSVPTDLFGLLEGVRSLMDVRVQEKRLRLSIHYSEPVPRLLNVDPKAVRQVLINLVGNALKFTEHGEITIQVRCLIPEEMLEIAIQDTGIGISEESASRLFQPFEQADISATRQIGGTGLGLTISKKLAGLLGGDVVLRRTEVGKGSTFVFSFSTGQLSEQSFSQDAVPKAVVEPVSNEPLPPLNATILAVDDRKDVRFLVRNFVESAGGTVVEASDGLDAVELWKNRPSSEAQFDAILMDMHMPRMDGPEATKSLREAGYEGPIIALTANTMGADREKCLKAGCTDFLSKPIDRTQLIQKLHGALQIQPD